MIIDVLTNSEKYEKLNDNFKIVFDYLKTHNLKEMDLGKHDIKGNELYFNLQEGDTKPTQKLEAHKKYIDIQVVIEGEEYMGYTNISNTTVSEEYNPEKDVMFLNGKVDKLRADETRFLIFYPEDAHMPSLCDREPQKVRKAIFKILIK